MVLRHDVSVYRDGGGITADKYRCIGAGHCVRRSPDLFDSGEDGLVVVVQPDPGPARADEVREVVALCPSGAISLSANTEL